MKWLALFFRYLSTYQSKGFLRSLYREFFFAPILIVLCIFFSFFRNYSSKIAKVTFRCTLLLPHNIKMFIIFENCSKIRDQLFLEHFLHRMASLVSKLFSWLSIKINSIVNNQYWEAQKKRIFKYPEFFFAAPILIGVFFCEQK